MHSSCCTNPSITMGLLLLCAGTLLLLSSNSLRQRWIGSNGNRFGLFRFKTNKKMQVSDLATFEALLAAQGTGTVPLLQDIQVIGNLSDVSDSHPVIQAVLERWKKESKPGKRFVDDKHKIALAIEGGGMRGCVSAGATAALNVLGINDAIDVVYGSSAGAMVGAYFISRQFSGNGYPLPEAAFVASTTPLFLTPFHLLPPNNPLPFLHLAPCPHIPQAYRYTTTSCPPPASPSSIRPSYSSPPVHPLGSTCSSAANATVWRTVSALCTKKTVVPSHSRM